VRRRLPPVYELRIRRVDMDSKPALGAHSVPALGHAASPDLRAEVLGTLLIFLFTLMVTAGVALCAHVMVRAVG